MREEFLWTEKYRPKKVADLILPDELKQTFQQFVDKGNLPNFLLAGGPGMGKTTVAKAMVEELGSDWMVINGSLDRNIDMLRTEIANFASTVSFSGGRKYVILDEADYLNANSTQPALRNFMEEFSKNCGFILTCNYKHRIIPAIAESRLAVVDFVFPKAIMPDLAKQFFERVLNILKTEKIAIEKGGEAAVAQLIVKYAPDWRRVLNELQRYSVSGKIDSGILAKFDEATFKDLIKEMKDKNYSAVRQWVAEQNMDQKEVFRRFYDAAKDLFKPSFIPALVVTLAQYQYKAAFAADPEINLAACLAEVMVDGEWK